MTATLQWVQVNGRLHHVADFAHLSPDRRPEAICPDCGQPVLMKLGQEKTWHAAHLAEAECALQVTETAVHFNSKWHLARQLETASTLRLLRSCRLCGIKQPMTWLTQWETVAVEYRLDDKLQPDLVLLRDGQPIAAIEVVVTHPISADKARRLRQRYLPWVEVAGCETLYTGDSAWTAARPLPIQRQADVLFPWWCRSCAMQLKELTHLPPWLHSQGKQVVCYRVMDVLYTDGRAIRQVYTLYRHFLAGIVSSFSLECYTLSTDEITCIAQIPAEDKVETAVVHLMECGRQVLQQLRDSHHLLLSSPMPWVYKRPLLPEQIAELPPVHFYEPASGRWLPRLGSTNICWLAESGAEGKPS